MAGEQDFADLLQRVRGGDPAAAAELVRCYEPEVRRAIRVRLTDPRLRRVLDSADVCQSVLANFFVRAAAGEFDLDRPEQLLALLVAMARNRLLDKVRRQRAGKRDQRRVEAISAAALDELQGSAYDPGRVVAGQDLLAAVRRLLTDEERYLADQRALGRDWADIALEQGARPDALRKKLSRALDRVTARLGLEEMIHA